MKLAEPHATRLHLSPPGWRQHGCLPGGEFMNSLSLSLPPSLPPSLHAETAEAHESFSFEMFDAL